MSPLESYYDQLPEPFQGTLLALREFLLHLDFELEEAYKWRLPVFLHAGKHVCYVSFQPKLKRCFIAFAAGNFLDHPLLINEGRKSVSHLELFPEEDLPVEAIVECIKQQIAWTATTGRPWVIGK